MLYIHFTSVQLTTTDPDNKSLNGYMVAPREDTGTTLDGSVAYVGSWETGTDLNLRCNGVSTFECKTWCILLLLFIFIGYGHGMCHLCSFFRGLWLSPTFWFWLQLLTWLGRLLCMDFRMLHFGMALCMDVVCIFCYSKSCPLCALDICDVQRVTQFSHAQIWLCSFYIVSNGIGFSYSFVAVHPSCMSCK